jgi:hypothetical protein
MNGSGARGWVLLVLLTLFGCDGAEFASPSGRPAPPRNLEGTYHARAVHLTWDLDARWDGEPFRVFGKRRMDRDHFLLAEVTSCREGRCSYRDPNVVPEVTYEYYVAAVGRSGVVAASAYAVEVHVPAPVPPPIPDDPEAVALDGAVYLHWRDGSRAAADFAFYRVYLVQEGSDLLLGETDSEGFLDMLAGNGITYRYFVTAVDDQGHESAAGPVVSATPRPDYRGEVIHAYDAVPELSGFRFQDDEAHLPIVHGSSPERHFRLEVDEDGWWIVPGPGVQLHLDAVPTSALVCGPGADAGCLDLRRASTSNFAAVDLELLVGYSYVLRIPATAGGWRYGVVRVSHLGFGQDGAVAIFDWAIQLQPDNPNLVGDGV